MSSELFLLSDEELVESVQAKNEGAFDELAYRYDKFINFVARKYFIKGATPEDVLQEASIGLYKAALSYCPNTNKSFRSFAFMCIQHNVQRAVSAGNRMKNEALKSYISVYSDDFKQEPEMLVFQKVAEAPEAYVIKNDLYSELNLLMENVLSEMERNILLAYIDGNSYKEISKLNNLDVKSIDNALQRARKKLSAHIDIDGYFHDIAMT